MRGFLPHLSHRLFLNCNISMFFFTNMKLNQQTHLWCDVSWGEPGAAGG